MEDIHRFKSGGKNTIQIVSKILTWSPLVLLIIYIIYLLVGLMTSKGLNFTGAIVFVAKDIFRRLYFILRPIIFIFWKVVTIGDFIFGDAWNSNNRIRSIIFTLASMIVLFGIGTIFIPELAGGMTQAQHALMMTWYGRIFIAIAVILAICLLFVFVKAFNLDLHNKSKSNGFPLDKGFGEQTAYLFTRSKSYLTVIIGIIIFLAILALIVWYMFSDKGDAFTGSYMLLIVTSIFLLAMIHVALWKSGVYAKIMQNSVIRMIYHSIFLIPCQLLIILNYLSKEMKHTPKSVYVILAVEIVFIIFFLLKPILKKYIYVATSGSGNDDIRDKEITALEQESINKSKKIKELRNIDTLGPKGVSYLAGSSEFWKQILLTSGDESKTKKIIIDILKKNYGVDISKKKKKVDKIYNKLIRNHTMIIKLKEDKIVLAEKRKKLELQLKENIGKLKSVLLLDKPVNINKKQVIGDHKNMRTLGDGDKDLDPNNFPLNYNYALSFWVYLNSEGPNYNSNSFKSLINYNDKPRVLFHPTRNEIAVIFRKASGKVVKHLIKNVKLQKWINLVINYDGGVLDIFKDGELVFSSPGEIPYMKDDVITIGENGALNGGICNVVYYNTHISKTRILTNYNFLKKYNPPVV